MNFTMYLKNRLLLITGQLLFIFLAFLYFYSLGITFGQFLFVALPYAVSVFLYYTIDYVRKRNYFRQIARSLRCMEEKYLLPEIFDGRKSYEDAAYMAILREMGNAMAERLETLSSRNRDYRELIEAWVHEIKQPLASIRLLGRSSDAGSLRRIQARAEEINHLTEQVLYYARSEELAADMAVHASALKTVLLAAIEENRYLLQLSGFTVEMPDNDIKVYTDEKSLLFVCSQIIRNAVAYRCQENPRLTLSCKSSGSQAVLSFADNGTGIAPEDIPRVFDKGFTGQNGRKNRRSTGIGLYLCRKFCRHMQADIVVSSREGEGTTVTVTLPAVPPQDTDTQSR